MKFMIDVDGVITESPEFFAAICSALRKDGHEIHIVSDFDENFRNQRERELLNFGITWDALIITAQKEKYCQKHAINYAIDDDMDYFGTFFKHTSINLISLKTFNT